jgi:hypothetical protein
MAGKWQYLFQSGLDHERRSKLDTIMSKAGLIMARTDPGRHNHGREGGRLGMIFACRGRYAGPGLVAGWRQGQAGMVVSGRPLTAVRLEN